ncbi:helix-turn-helix domain-containing protein [Ochrobactrum teleogrylli]|uniref:Helix-turn-helix domain-containing protein n=1 Tax=Ochrobactrum teleogrylli TaxID=2479765 RepID=A0ABD5JQL7_9HYPH
MTIGRDIRLARKRSNKTQQDVADHLGVSVQAISQWENDKTLPNTKNLLDLSQYLGMSVQTPQQLLDMVPLTNRTQSYVVAPLVEWNETDTWHLYNRDFAIDDFTDEQEYKYATDHFTVNWKPVGEIYALRVDSSLYVPSLAKGDVIIIDTGRAPENGDIVVAEVEQRKIAILGIYKHLGVDENRAPIIMIERPERSIASVVFDKETPGHVIGVVREQRRFYRVS